MDGTGGLEGWRWIFVLEGIATVLVAILAFWALYDYPETAGFLTSEEKEFVIFRLENQGGMQTAVGEGVDHFRVREDKDFKWEYVRQAFKDWQVWVFIIAYWGVSLLHMPHLVSSTGRSSFPMANSCL